MLRWLPVACLLIAVLSGITAPSRAQQQALVDQRLGPALQIPPRPPTAPPGSAFAKTIRAMRGPLRERAILAQLLAGNIPDFLRRFQPVQLAIDRAGRTVSATIWVAPDYLAIGSDQDFVRMPMGLATAARVATSFGAMLPTRKIVDAIHRQASIRLTPSPMPPGPSMTSTGYFIRHNTRIEQQLEGHPRGPLVSGHKKDLVLSNRLVRRPSRVAIYGWHRPGGSPIQPLSTVHGAAYADYSHGVRLVASIAMVDGVARSVQSLLADPQLAGLLTLEGSIPAAARFLRQSAGSLTR